HRDRARRDPVRAHTARGDRRGHDQRGSRAGSRRPGRGARARAACRHRRARHRRRARARLSHGSGPYRRGLLVREADRLARAKLRAVADARVDRLRSVPLFGGCSDKELSFIASRADEVDLPSGKVLTEKGKSGGDFFIILEGKAEVEAAGGKRTLGPGDFFGEIALIDNGPRTATVKTATPM